MKKIGGLLLLALSILLIIDTWGFWYRLSNPDGGGTALYLFGFYEVNDRIPFAQATPYLIGLILASIVLIGFTMKYWYTLSKSIAK